MPPDGKRYYEDEFKYTYFLGKMIPMDPKERELAKIINDTARKFSKNNVFDDKAIEKTVYGKVSDMLITENGMKAVASLVYPNYLGKHTGNWRIDVISKIIQSGPCTILITYSGRYKVIVRNQDKDIPFDPFIGFLMVLIKYMFDKKIYTDIVEYVFAGRSLNNELDKMSIIAECKAVLISKIGKDNLNQLLDKFRESL